MRRRVAFFCVCAVIASALGFKFASWPATTSSVTVHSIRSTSVGSDDYQLSVENGAPLLDGCQEYDPVSWRVDPSTLALASLPCGALPTGVKLSYETEKLASIGVVGDCKPQSAGVRLTRRAASGTIVPFGGLLMRFAGYCSTTQPTTEYFGGALWMYDCTVGPTGDGGEMVEVSATTGAVETDALMPSDCHTILGVDAAGAFVASYDNPGSIYFVAAGSHRAVTALRTGGRVNWFEGAGEAAYADISSDWPGACNPSKCGVWSFAGRHASPRWLTNSLSAGWIGASPAISDGGLFTTSQLSSRAQGPDVYEVVRIDLGSGAVRSLARLNIDDPNDWRGPLLVYVHRYLFVLAGDTLYRYTLS